MKFWTVLAMSVLSLLVGLGVVGPDFAKKHEDVVNAVAVLASVLGPAIYAVAHSIASHGHQTAVAQVLSQRIAYGRDSGVALLLLIALILIVVGAILLIVAAANGATTFPPYVPGIVLIGVGLVLLLFRGSGGRVTL